MKNQLILILLLAASQARATTYYVDFVGGSDANAGTSKAAPWKCAPGMKGFTGGYTHAAGDQFVFKGGVTWPHGVLPLHILYSGAPGAVDAYGGLDTTWYSGAAWSQPKFDGEQLMAPNGTVIHGGVSFVRVTNLAVVNSGNPSDPSGTAVALSNGSNIEVDHCTIQPHSIQSFAYGNAGAPVGTTSSHILFHDNDLSSEGRFVIYGYAGRVLDDVEVYHNRVQGKGAYNPGGYHMDGLMIGNPIYSSDPAQVATVTHISFHDNYFYGSWPGGATAMYFACSNTNYTEIFNNVFALETTDSNVGYIMRWQHHDGNISIYNNTFSSDAHPGAHAGATGVMIIADTYQPHHYGTLSIKNNILSGFGIDISGITISDWDSIDIDYNLHHISTAHGYGYPVWVGSKACKTLACAQSTWGYEMHSPAMGAPKFVAVPNGTAGSGDFHLLPSSPAIGTGINLSSVFTTDAAGRPRPSTGPWDMGAYVEGSNQPRPVISGQPALQNKH
jgi:hypothetical protein